MLQINCPFEEKSSTHCKWVLIPGSVRDQPGVGLLQCSDCHLVTHSKDLSQDVNYESGTMHDWASGYSDSLAPPVEDINRRLEAIRAMPNAGSKKLLDFGCGFGTMLNALASDFEVSGLEPDEGARLAARGEGHKVYSDTNEILNQNSKFDFVTLFHVVEHFYEPSVEFQRIYEILNPGGYLIIETPNSNDALLTFYENEEFQKFTYWSHHPMLHSSKSLSSVVSRNGFRVTSNGGVQRYGLNNHLYWLANGKPGGHEAWKTWIPTEIEPLYEQMLINRMACDTLWLIAQKEA